jgi:RNA polymerase sigma factor (TIGR02999 family)
VSDITSILSQIERGNAQAADELLPLVYQELRKLASARLAREQPGQTLQATALVHDAYLRLVEHGAERKWNSRGHFFGAAARAMRRILVENARRKATVRHGGSCQRIDMPVSELIDRTPGLDILAIDVALQRLASRYPEHAELVQLRYFAGLTQAQSAAALNLSLSTADRYWKFARAWLARELKNPPKSASN